MEKLHIPVLLSEVLSSMQPRPGEAYLDLTAGFGGHAREILDATRNYKDSVLVDRDQFAVDYLRSEMPTGLTILHTDFYNAVLQLYQCGKTFDLILADFGVSSPQLDREDRGFSFHRDGPLDMRMDRSQSLTAGQIINHWSESALANLLVKYGELSSGRAVLLARAIVHHRPIRTTRELADLVLNKSRWSKTHPAAPVFQAIRIAVNDELTEIEQTLPLLIKLARPGGRLGFITFHSLEDRLVKRFLQASTSLGEESPLALVNKKPLVAGNQELVNNPRARSAKLRVAMRNC